MNTAAVFGDFHVVETRGAHLLLIRARAAENGVRVGIDETRREHSAGAVDLARGTIPLAKSRLWTYLGDLLADDNDGGTR